MRSLQLRICCQALPMVNQISEKLRQFIKHLQSPNGEISESERPEDFDRVTKKSLSELKEELIASLEWLRAEGAKHQSVDTFAKKLEILGEVKSLKRLKIALSVYFTYEQLINSPDPRYDSFFASLLDTLGEFPAEARVLSWNYDSQFELSYLAYIKDDHIQTARKRLPAMRSLQLRIS